MKTAIYIRTSTTEQFPEKQLSECKQFASNKGYEIEGIYEEQLSGWKDLKRPKYEEIKEKARKGEIKAVIVWALDRWVRNRETLLDDVVILRNYGCKLHSVKEAWLEAVNIDGPIGKTVQDFLLGLIGSIAELEGMRKSERMKMAFENYKGNKWGRPNVESKVRDKVINLYEQGRTYNQICSEVFYWNSSNRRKNVSKGLVHKIISKYQLEKPSQEKSHKEDYL